VGRSVILLGEVAVLLPLASRGIRRGRKRQPATSLRQPDLSGQALRLTGS
jgi:hypothetical protein